VARGVKVVLVGLVLGGATLVGLLFVFQNKLIYFPRRYSAAQAPGGGAAAAFHSFSGPGGRRLWGYLIEPPASAWARPRPGFYLVFYGNATLAAEIAPYFEALARRTGCGFFIADYRGYGFNPGRPTEAALTADALAAYDALAAEGRFEEGAGLIGLSLGGGVAFAVAEARPAERLIALSTFTSIDDVARHYYPRPLTWLLRNHWPNDARLRRILARPAEARPSEILILHGRSDEVIPFELGERLARLGGSAVTFQPVEATHNDVLEAAFDALVESLEGRK